MALADEWDKVDEAFERLEAYDPVGNLAAIAHRFTVGNGPTHVESYTHDAHGNILLGG